MSEDLEDLRTKIDHLDSQLLNILAQRMKQVALVGKYKKSKGIPPLDEARWNSALRERLNIADELGLSQEYVTRLFNLIHEYALELESESK